MLESQRINYKYVLESRAILQTAVGQAKMRLKDNDADKAKELLDKGSKDSAACFAKYAELYQEAIEREENEWASNNESCSCNCGCSS